MSISYKNAKFHPKKWLKLIIHADYDSVQVKWRGKGVNSFYFEPVPKYWDRPDQKSHIQTFTK